MKEILYTGNWKLYRWMQVVNIVDTKGNVHTGMRVHNSEVSTDGIQDYIDKMVIEVRFVQSRTISTIYAMFMSADGYSYTECLQDKPIEMIDR